MRPGLADRERLLLWARSLGARGELPRLIRRLILETGRKVVDVDFPAGEGVASAGWDGVVRAMEPAPHIPLGLSLWEVSAGKSTDAKATKDYVKRLTTQDGSPTGEATYVAVSLRPWNTRSTWEKDRAADGRWHAVRALGVDDIETWLESAPVTHAWLSDLLGLQPHGIVAAETWWSAWSCATAPPLPPDVVLAGRESAVERLKTELSQPAQIITVHGASSEDVLAFSSAAATADDTGAFLSRLAFVDDPGAWRALRDQRTPLVLVPRGTAVAEISAGSPHHVIVPIVGSERADITLPPIDPQLAADALVAGGLSKEEAEECGRVARLSLLAARRRIAVKPELHRPSWAKAPAAKPVRRTLLAGWWSEEIEGDREVVSDLVGVDYDAVRETFAELLAQEDPLLTRLDSSLALVSHFDAWLLLAGDLSKHDLEAFEVAALRVLGEADPRFELPSDERWRAGILGKVRGYSGGLRAGLATTLALLGSNGERTIGSSSLTGAEWAKYVVRSLLEQANGAGSCLLWASLRDVLPDLAEAAPSEFLEAVRTGVNGKEPLLTGMFMDQDRHAFSTETPHTNLLWALENCVWSPDHFGQTVDLLARLAELDPDGTYSNRPAATLVAIFRPWYPQNSVSVARRLDALDALRERHGAVSWPLLVALIPDMHGFALPLHAPRFRRWKPEEITVTHADYRASVEGVAERLFEDAGDDAKRWMDALEKLDDLPPTLREVGLTKLGMLADVDAFEQADRAQLWEKLRSLAARHREYATAEWAMAETDLIKLDAVAKRLEPQGLVERNAWLFDDELVDIPDVQRQDNFQEYSRALAELRAQAARELVASIAWPELLAFAVARKLPWRFGIALAEAGAHKHEMRLLELLDSDDNAQLGVAGGYFDQRFRTDGWPWVESHLASDTLTPKQAGRLLLCAADPVKAWQRADALGEDVAAAYWREFRTHGHGADFPHVATAAERLLRADRPAIALDLLALYRRDGGRPEFAELMAQGLEALLARESDPEIAVLAHYELAGIFAYLESSDLPIERLARLEWVYLQALGYNARPAALGRMLAQDPNFFVDIISKIYRAHESDKEQDEAPPGSEETEASAQDRAIATNAYRLLSEWRVVPGTGEDGTIDGKALRQWVLEAREKLRGCSRLTVGDQHIGQVLIGSPSDPDGVWPCREVRDFLEELQNEDVEHGLRIAISNSRGATSRGVFDGGDQERELAASYRGKAVQVSDRWPRTAAIFIDLAESYERQGRRHDEEAERRRKGFDR